MLLYQPRCQLVVKLLQEKHIQGWEIYPLALQTFRSYIDDLHHSREQLEKKSSVLFVKESHKIALELLLQSDDGKANTSPMTLLNCFFIFR